MLSRLRICFETDIAFKAAGVYSLVSMRGRGRLLGFAKETDAGAGEGAKVS